MSDDVPGAAALRDAHAAALACPELVGAALREALTDAVDTWLRDRLADATKVAVVAVGSLGRRELAAGSDLDLLLLYRDRHARLGLRAG